MNFKSRVAMLEQIASVFSNEPRSDLSALTVEELKFLLRHHGSKHPTETKFSDEVYYQPYDDMMPEERENKFKDIYSKIKWEGGQAHEFKGGG